MLHLLHLHEYSEVDQGFFIFLNSINGVIKYDVVFVVVCSHVQPQKTGCVEGTIQILVIKTSTLSMSTME